jgi:hypothetical protein
MPVVADSARCGGSDGEELVLTQALLSLRRSALRCRRARLLIEEHDVVLPPLEVPVH